jgi:beta-lactamase class A
MAKQESLPREKNPLRRWQLACVVLVVALAAALAMNVMGTSGDRCVDRNFLINPRFACGKEFAIRKTEYRELRSELLQYVDTQKEAGNVREASIYFRDLEAGPVMGINESEAFIPASLLKIPLALAFFSLREEQSEKIFEERIAYVRAATAPTPVQTFKPKHGLVDGEEYSIEELIERTLIYSDNESAEVLYEYLLRNYGYGTLAAAYRNLGIVDVGADINVAAVTAKDYASVFRQLYNASYLNPGDSQHFLSLLAKTEFDYALTLNLPREMRVVHKFGERYLDDGEKQLHDCGIVYYPGNPYLLCVMTKGVDFTKLQGFIGHVSRRVYEEVDARKI